MRAIGFNSGAGGFGWLSALGRHSRDVAISLERLSTGKRINRASDDPAGAVTVDELKARQVTAQKRIENIDRESTYLGAKEGASSVLADMLLDLQGHVIKAANRGGVSAEERDASQIEVDSILSTIDHLVESQTWGDRKLLEGLGTLTQGTIHRTRAGEDGEDESITFSLASLRSGAELNLTDGNTQDAAAVVGEAIRSLASVRGAIGTRLQSMDTERNGLYKELESLAAVRSSIEDTDYAKETAELIRARTMQQASIFTNQLAQKLVSTTVLSLLATA